MIETNIWIMMGMVFFRNKRLESLTMQNIKIIIQINIMFSKMTILKIQEYVGHVQEEN